MADAEVWIGFFDDVEDRDGKVDFKGYLATGLRVPSRDTPIAAIHCVVFGRVHTLAEVPYRLNISYLGDSENGLEAPFEQSGMIPREGEVEGEWTFQITVEITELKFDADFVIRAVAEVGDARSMAHLKVATSTAHLNALTPLLTAAG